MDIIKSIEHEQMKNKIPYLKVGDTVKVHVRVKEGNRERIQVFEGIVIKKQGGGVNETFTVRRISYGVGVEKTFLIHSPAVEKVGARIETKELTIKEELVEEPAEEVKEEAIPEVEPEAIKEEIPETKTEEPKAE